MPAADDKAAHFFINVEEIATVEDLAEYLMKVAARNTSCREKKREVTSTQSVRTSCATCFLCNPGGVQVENSAHMRAPEIPPELTSPEPGNGYKSFVCLPK